MPVYKAIVEGQNFVFVFDDEPQHLAFHRTIYLEASNEEKASEQALLKVKHELETKELALNNGLGNPQLELEDIEELADNMQQAPESGDFVWFVSDEEEELEV